MDFLQKIYFLKSCGFVINTNIKSFFFFVLLAFIYYENTGNWMSQTHSVGVNGSFFKTTTLELFIYTFFAFDFFLPSRTSCQPFYFYAPLSNRSPLIVPPPSMAGSWLILFLPNRKIDRFPVKHDKEIPLHFTQPPSLLRFGEEKSNAHSAAVCPSTRSINVRGPSSPEKLFRGTGIWSIVFPYSYTQHGGRDRWLAIPLHLSTQWNRFYNTPRRSYLKPKPKANGNYWR